MTAYSPLGNTNPTYAEGSAKTDAEDFPPLLEHTAVTAIAQAHNCTATQVLVAWGQKRGTSVITKSTNKVHIKENFAADVTRCITDDDAQLLAATLPVKRFNNPSESWGISLFEGLEGVVVEVQQHVEESVLEHAEEIAVVVAKWGMMEMWAGVKGVWSFASDMIGDDGF